MDSKEARGGGVGGGSGGGGGSGSEISGPGVSQPITTPLVSSKSLLASSSGGQKCTESSPGVETTKILSRNCNGTVVLTSSPNNEAELQLYRVMQRASLLAYYDTLLEMGGDDVQQLCDAGEEEFLEIMALVGMASKPLHVRRLQKALQEWVTSPALFQIPLTTAVPTSPNNISHLSNIRPLNTLTGVTPAATLSPASFPASANHTNHAIAVAKEIPPSPSPDQPQVVNIDTSNSRSENVNRGPSPGPIVTNQGPGSPLQMTPVLVESQISKLAEAAEALVKTLPQFEPKPHNAKKKICRELENVMNMAEDDPRRMDELRKYAAIYGRFDCKRNPQKPLTLHEVSVNEAAAQICRFAPALLTRRDDLFSLARQVVRDSGYHYIKGHSSIASGYRSHSFLLSNKNLDESLCTKRSKVDAMSSLSSLCDNGDVERLKRQERLEQIADELRVLSDKTEELVQAAQQVRQNNDVSAVQSLQQQMEAVQNKQTQLLLEQSDLLKQPLPSRFYRRYSTRLLSNQIDSEKHDTDDTDSQFSLSNASSPSQEVGDSRDSLLRDGENLSNNSNGSPSVKSPGKLSKQYVADILSDETLRHHKDDFYFQDSKVQVISASGGNIIAVANPALSMSSVILQTSDSNVIKSDSPFSLKVETQSYENHRKRINKEEDFISNEG